MKDQLELDLDTPSRGETQADKLFQLSRDLLKFRVDIERALEYSHGSYSYDDVVGGILQGRFHFYPGEQSFVIGELQQFPNYSVYHLFLAGGNMEEVEHICQTKAHPVATALGAKYASLNGRPGWERALKDKGWEKTYTVMYSEIEHG